MSLSASELFFFVDEWGPVQVRKRGGKAYSPKHAIPIISAASDLEGNSGSCCRLECYDESNDVDLHDIKRHSLHDGSARILHNQYQTHSKLYVTWDAVSWHNSTTLRDWLDQFNETTRRQPAGPIIELVPLPTSAQFLNVIEGVLSGMTRAVIDNSDYSSPDDMKFAISRHFTDRNSHFKDNPRRAGKAIWDVDLFHGFDAFSAGDLRE